jgi:hypothetical protein
MQQCKGSLSIHGIRILPLRFKQANCVIVKAKANSLFSYEEIILTSQIPLL